MHEDLECQEIAPLLAGRVNDRLEGEEAARVEEHLTTCPSCRATADALDLAWRASRPPRSDLWPVLRSRLAVSETASERGDRVQLVLPAPSWQVAAALAVVVLTLVVMPDPARFAVALGLL